MPGDPNEKRITFAGAPSASTTSAWNLSPLHAPAFFPPLPLRSATRSISASELSTSSTMPLSRVREVDSETLEDVSDNLSALLYDTDVLRMYIALDEMPFALLDALYTQLQNNRHISELHICVKASLRAALGIISKGLGLERGLKQLIRKWASSEAALIFHFLLPECIEHSEKHTFDKHHRVDLLPALNSLGKGPAVLDGILSIAEDNARDGQASMHQRGGNEFGDEDMMDLTT